MQQLTDRHRDITVITLREITSWVRDQRKKESCAIVVRVCDFHPRQCADAVKPELPAHTYTLTWNELLHFLK